MPNHSKTNPDNGQKSHAKHADHPSTTTVSDMLSLAHTHSDALVQFGARLLIVGEMLRALLPELSSHERKAVSQRFRLRVDAVLAATDDIALPDAYHSALLSEINLFLQSMKG